VPVLVAVGSAGRRAPLALAITSAGGAVGSAVLPPLAVLLAERIGLLGCLTALAAGSAGVLLGSAATPVPPGSASGRRRPAPAPRSSGPLRGTEWPGWVVQPPEVGSVLDGTVPPRVIGPPVSGSSTSAAWPRPARCSCRSGSWPRTPPSTGSACPSPPR